MLQRLCTFLMPDFTIAYVQTNAVLRTTLVFSRGRAFFTSHSYNRLRRNLLCRLYQFDHLNLTVIQIYQEQVHSGFQVVSK